MFFFSFAFILDWYPFPVPYVTLHYTAERDRLPPQRHRFLPLLSTLNMTLPSPLTFNVISNSLNTD